MPRPRTAGDYQDGITAASRSGLAEVMTALGAYKDALVLIGGWAPYLILEQQGEQGAFQPDAVQKTAFQVEFVHVGSIDIDFVVDPRLVDARTEEHRHRTSQRMAQDKGHHLSQVAFSLAVVVNHFSGRKRFLIPTLTSLRLAMYRHKILTKTDNPFGSLAPLPTLCTEKVWASGCQEDRAASVD